MGTSDRRRRERERNCLEMVAAARELFFAKGYDNTSMDEIAERLEISKGKLYTYFASKEELYYAVAKEGMVRVREMFQEACRTEGSGIERLMAAGDAYVRFWTENPDYRRLLIDAKMSRPPASSGPQGQEFAKIAEESNRILAEAAREGMADGTMRSDVSPEKFVFCASSMIEGILVRTERYGGSVTSDRWRDETLAYASRLWRDAVTARRQE